MKFGRSAHTDRTAAPGTDYGSPAVRSNRLHRPLLAANHAVHTISSLIVLGISAYFINEYTHDTHLRYWVALVCHLAPRLLPLFHDLTTDYRQAAIDTLLYLPAVALPAVKKYKGYLAPLVWIMSYLWLTAFIFAAQDYEYNGGCAANSPRFVNKCGLKRTLEAFAFVAFFTSLVGTLLEARLWDVQRFKGAHAADVGKVHGVEAVPGASPVAHQTV